MPIFYMKSIGGLFSSVPGPAISDISTILLLPHLLVPLMSVGLAPLLIRLYTKLGRWLRFGQYDVGIHE